MFSLVILNDTFTFIMKKKEKIAKDERDNFKIMGPNGNRPKNFVFFISEVGSTFLLLK